MAITVEIYELVLGDYVCTYEFLLLLQLIIIPTDCPKAILCMKSINFVFYEKFIDFNTSCETRYNSCHIIRAILCIWTEINVHSKVNSYIVTELLFM